MHCFQLSFSSFTSRSECESFPTRKNVSIYKYIFVGILYVCQTKVSLVKGCWNLRCIISWVWSKFHKKNLDRCFLCSFCLKLHFHIIYLMRSYCFIFIIFETMRLNAFIAGVSFASFFKLLELLSFHQKQNLNYSVVKTLYEILSNF